MTTSPVLPVVYDLDRQYRRQEPLQVFDLAETMRTHLADETAFTDLVTHAWEVRESIQRTIAEIDRRAVPQLLDLDLDAIPDAVRGAAHDAAALIHDAVGYTGARRAADDLEQRLEEELRAKLPPFADRVVKAVRPTFDEHAAAIDAALDAGITRETEAAELAEKGTEEQLRAFRALPRAVAGLEQIKRLRDSLTLTLPYGPRDLLGLAYVGEVSSRSSLELVQTRSADETEWAQYNVMQGAAVVKLDAEHLGGRWLHMRAAGLTLHLNTASEVESLRASATAA